MPRRSSSSSSAAAAAAAAEASSQPSSAFSSSPRSSLEQMEVDAQQYLQMVGEYKHGSIARIKLKDFLTYNAVEFRPGPRLNMVVGPNGTGKSSILCAICLGLGGEPRLLGRASEVDTFIKTGEDTAEIEIELVNENGGPNAVISRIIRKVDKPKSSFLWNGEAVSSKIVKDRVAKDFHIQIGNLCTFLPQEKVGNFSGFDSKALLLETEKTMGKDEEKYKMHMELIELQEELIGGDDQVETLEEKLANLTAQHNRLGREVEREEARQKALEQVDLLNKKILWMKTDALREECIELKEVKEATKNQVDEAKQEVEPLNNAHTQAKMRLDKSTEQIKEFEKMIAAHKKEIQKQRTKYESHDDRIEELIHELAAMDNQRATLQEKADTQRKQVNKFQNAIEESLSLEELQEQHEKARLDHQALHPQYNAAKKEQTVYQRELATIEEEIKRLERHLKKVQDAKAQQRQKVFGRDENLKKAYDWIRQHGKEFRKEVVGPIACEVTAKSEISAAYLEQHVPTAVLKSFIVQDRADYDYIYKGLREGLQVPINLLQIDRSEGTEARLYSDEQMDLLKREHGVLGYLDEQFEAKPVVIQALKGSAQIHKVLVGSDATQESIDSRNLGEFLSQPKERSGNLQSYCIFTSKGGQSFKYTSQISKYSKKASLRVDDIRPAKLLSRGARDDQHKETRDALDSEKARAMQVQEAMASVAEKLNETMEKTQEAQQRVKEYQDAIRQLKRAQNKLDIEKRKLAEYERDLERDDEEAKSKIVELINQRVRNALKAVSAQADSQKKMVQTHIRASGAHLNQEAAVAEESSARMKLEDFSASFTEIKLTAAEAKARFNQKKQEFREIQARAQAEAPLEDEDGNDLPLKAILAGELSQFSDVPLAEAALEEAERMVSDSVANPNAVRLYKELEQQIEETQADLDDFKNRKDKRMTEMQRIQAPWEASLEETVERVDKKFGQYMRELGCVGSVSLAKGAKDDPDPKFRDYGIEIKVSFRDGVAPSVLSARVQSGGERSVSTIMYLMALQDEMKAPFRCVDEINQGLDERNERLVFKRIVANSTKEPGRKGLTDHSGQYWLITPKLLPNLTDMEVEAMTVVCIFNGAYNLKNPNDWDTEKLINLRKRHGAASHPEEEEEVVEEEKEAERIPKRKKRKSEEPQAEEEDEEEDDDDDEDLEEA